MVVRPAPFSVLHIVNLEANVFRNANVISAELSLYFSVGDWIPTTMAGLEIDLFQSQYISDIDSPFVWPISLYPSQYPVLFQA